MSTSRIDSGSNSAVSVQPARTRQTEAPATPFRDVLAGGVKVLMTGAEVGASVMGGPVLAAAVHAAGVGAATQIAPGGSPATGTFGGNAGVPGSATSEMAGIAAMQRENQAFNLQLINLQEDIQKDSRQFNTVSNVLRAKHDTAKSSIGNIRS